MTAAVHGPAEDPTDDPAAAQPDGPATDGLAELWEWVADSQFRGYSPLYERIARAVSASPAVLALHRAAPPDAHLPPVLLGAVHFLVLGGVEHPLADVYAGRSGADPGPLFVAFCEAHHRELAALLEVRRLQTNDCGRSALLGPALSWLEARLPGPAALVDVGASAGLTLVADRYRLDYGARGATGPTDSPVQIHCEVVGGDPPIPPQLPRFLSREGLDRSPVDLSDPDDARWLLACVWPDTGRLERTAASIRLAQEALPAVRRGDAVDDLPGLLDRLDPGAAVVILNTWSFSYLGLEQRQDYLAVLANASRTRPVAWLVADAGAVLDELATVDGLAGLGPPDPSAERRTSVDDNGLGAVLFQGGAAESAVLLAGVHQHGAWIDWRADR